MGNVARGLVPCWGRGRGRGMAESPVRIRRMKRQLRFSSLGVPAQAGMGDWYDNGRTS